MTWHRKKSLHDLHRLGPYRQEAHTDSATRSPPHRVTPKVHRPPPPPLSHTHIAQQTEIHTAISNRLVKIKSKMQTIINRPPSEPWQRPHRVKGIKVPKRPRRSWHHISSIRLPSATGARCTRLLMVQPLTGDTNICVRDDRDRCQ